MDLLHHPHSPVSLDTVTILSCACLPFCHQSSCDPPSRGLHKTSEGALWHLTLAWVFRLFCEMLDWIEIWGTGSLSLHLEPVVFLRLFLQSGRVCYPAGRNHCLLCLFFSYSGWYISNQHPDEWQEPRFPGRTWPKASHGLPPSPPQVMYAHTHTPGRSLLMLICSILGAFSCGQESAWGTDWSVAIQCALKLC